MSDIYVRTYFSGHFTCPNRISYVRNNGQTLEEFYDFGRAKPLLGLNWDKSVIFVTGKLF